MINDLKEEIKKQLSKEYKYVSNYMIESNLLNLLVLKYYCDTSNLKYENLISIENEKTKEIELPDDPLLKKIINVKFTKLLSHIRYENIQELIKEYLYHEDITLNIINSKEKKVCIPSAFSNSLYDLDGNTTYVIDYFKITPYEISKFQFFDKVLNNHNEYLIMYTNENDKSNELVKIDFDGLIKNKVKKIKNDYYNITNFNTYNNTIYFIGQITCPEDETCDYDANSLFLISDQDKVIEVQQKEASSIGIVTLLSVVAIMLVVIVRKKSKKERA